MFIEDFDIYLNFDNKTDIYKSETLKRYHLYKLYLEEYNQLNNYYNIDSLNKKYIYNGDYKNEQRLAELKILIKSLLKKQREFS